jgi:malate dehydrogenase (oxaloacetate-decarboxylating)(NADP+)
MDTHLRERIFSNSRLNGTANLLVMSNADAVSIAVNLLKELGDGVTVGPIMLGLEKSAHVLTQSASVRSLVNMSAIAVEHTLRIEQGPLCRDEP